jgi:hypothetical protein
MGYVENPCVRVCDWVARDDAQNNSQREMQFFLNITQILQSMEL